MNHQISETARKSYLALDQERRFAVARAEAAAKAGRESEADAWTDVANLLDSAQSAVYAAGRLVAARMERV